MVEAQGGPRPEPGWYRDPVRSGRERRWDGEDWTDEVRRHAGADTEVEPLPPVDEATNADPRTGDPRSAWPTRAAAVAVAGWILAAVCAGLVAVLLDDAAEWARLLAAQAVLWTLLVATCLVVSHRWGSGDLADDFELELTRHDLWPGVAAGLGARGVAAAAAVLALLATGGDITGEGQLDHIRTDAGIALALALALLGAPVIEELFFRGLLQRALQARIGTVAAIAASAVAFGIVHYQSRLDADTNWQVIAAVTAAGAVLGVTVQLTRRLGPAIVGHALFNLPAAIALVASR